MAEYLKLPRGALAALRRGDPALGRVIDRVGPFRLVTTRAEGHLAALVRSIVYQQLSGKAAATIHARVLALFPEGRFPTPEEVLDADEAALRGCGLSRQKLAALRDLCVKVESGDLPLDRIDDLDDEPVIEALTQVHGIGRWSAEMYLLFHLGRLDVWPVTDLGIRKAVARLVGREDLPHPDAVREVGERFRPYRSVATWYLWRTLDEG